MIKKLLLVILIFTASYPLYPHQARKIFFVTGEASGDQLGAWWFEKVKKDDPSVVAHALGGDALHNTGATIWQHYQNLELGFVGIGRFFGNIPTRWRLHKEIMAYITKNSFSDVVLVDCPLTNFPLARAIKNNHPSITITYIAPPEMWLWGRWGMDRWLKAYCDEIVVIYPFEQEWYAQHGLTTSFYGYPFYEQYDQTTDTKKSLCALLPGSRRSEIETMLPLFCETAQAIHEKHPSLSFLLFAANDYSVATIQQIVESYGLSGDIQIIAHDDKERKELLANCCCALTKPGTITLQLGLLHVPSVIAFKTSWITYWLARLFFNADYVGLPNLIMQNEVFKEFIQGDCTVDNLTAGCLAIIDDYVGDKEAYDKRVDGLRELNGILAHTPYLKTPRTTSGNDESSA